MISTSFLIKPISTKGDKPILFGCNDGNEYYVKELQGGKRRRSLINEWLGASLARMLEIPVPEWAAVFIHPDSYDPGRLIPSGRRLTHNISFGSRHIDSIDFADEIVDLTKKRSFDQVTNPETFFKILVFDLWIANGDRHQMNYNLLLRRQDYNLTFYAIDHSFMFEDLEYSKILLEQSSFQGDSGCLRGTNAFGVLLKRIGWTKIRAACTDAYDSISAVTPDSLQLIFDSIPVQWQLTEVEQDSLRDFLINRREALHKHIKSIHVMR